MYCREHYTDLATVSNIDDMNRLVNTAQDSTGGFTGKAWIGLHDNLTSWRWSLSDSRYYGEKEADYRNWDFGQPDNFLGDQICVKMWSGGVWEDSWCFLRNPFICYDGLGSDFTVLNSDLWRSFSELFFFSSSGKASAYQRFIFVEQELSWSGAQLYCRTYHTDLASVRNQRENQEIQLLAQHRSIWIGLYRSGKCDVSLFVWWRVTYLARWEHNPLSSYFILPVLGYETDEMPWQSSINTQNTAESCWVESLETTQGPLISFLAMLAAWLAMWVPCLCR